MNLKEFLDKNRYSVTLFSDLLGCSRSHLSRIIHGKAKPSKRLAQHIHQITTSEVSFKVYSEAPSEKINEK